MSTSEKTPVSGRNSLLRELFDRPLTSFVTMLHRRFPDLTPNQITYGGLLGVTAATVLTYLRERHKQELTWQDFMLLGTAFILASALDAFDGKLARIIHQENGSPEETTDEASSSTNGSTTDARADRLSEAIVSALEILRAWQNKDYLWLASAVLVALSNPLPSIIRAQFEGRMTKDLAARAADENVRLHEGGGSPVKFFGTRAGRFILALLAFAPHKELASSISPHGVLAAFRGAVNILVAIDRVKEVRALEQLRNNYPDDATAAPSNEQLKAITREKELRKVFYLIAAITAVLAGGITLQKWQQKN